MRHSSHGNVITSFIIVENYAEEWPTEFWCWKILVILLSLTDEVMAAIIKERCRENWIIRKHFLPQHLPQILCSLISERILILSFIYEDKNIVDEFYEEEYIVLHYLIN